MDKFLLCLLATYSVVCGLKFVCGAGDRLSPGLAVRQGEPTSVIAQKNGELLLNCSVEHDTDLGPPRITWQQDGGPVDIGKRVQLMSNGSLYIRRIIHRPKKSRTDAGVYDCIATLGNIGSIIARRVRVQVAGIEKKFDQEPQPQRVPVGGVARFQCQIDAVPPAIYIWERNGTQLPQEDSRFIKLSSGILQIINVQEGDTGSYRCHATQGSLHELPDEVDNIYRKTSAEASLEVFKGTLPRPVKIHTSTSSITAKVGTTAVLECLVDGYAGSVQWRRESSGQVIEFDNRVKRVANNLKFVAVELSDSGNYQCVAGQKVATLKLNVIAPPVFTKKPASETYPKAKWIYMDCEADGIPKPKVTWLQNGLPVVFKSPFEEKGNQLVILQPDVSHSGFYQCLVENEAGFELAFGRLEIYLQSDDVPGPPENLRVIDVTKSEITVKWDHAKTKPCCPVLAYTVHYSEYPRGELKDEVTTDTQYILKELEPFRNYSIYVKVYASQGAGVLDSDIVYAKTKEDVPRKPVTFTLEPQDKSILVKWEELPAGYRNGIITEYQINHRRVIDDVPVENIEEGISPTARSFLIQDLEPNTEYEVRMKAATQVGFKSFQNSEWPWVPVRTLTTAGAVPSEIQVFPINKTAVNITWSHGGNAKIKSFTVQLRNLSAHDNRKTVVKLTPETRHFVLSHLITDSMYEVTLVKEDVDGNTSVTAVEFDTSSTPRPPAPTNLVTTLISTDSLSLEWYQPRSDMKILHYTVKYYELLSGDIPGTPRLQTSKYNSILLERLKPYTRYKVFVRAHTEHLMSQYSRPVIGWTKEGVPSAPQDIKITSSKPGFVCIEWSAPAIPNGKITSYIIQYSDTPDIEDEEWNKVEKNGSVNSAVISIPDIAGKTYFFKVYASTQSGHGKPTQPVPLVPGVPYTDRSENNTEASQNQTLGILIGVSIGVFCIIVCIIIILLRNKYFPTNQNPAPQTQPIRCNGNGHIPGNGHAVPVREHPQAIGMYELETYTPMLDHLPENENSDSKGGGGGNVILTPNGAKLNGFFPMTKNGMRNGQLPNGHMTTVLSNQYRDSALDAEETRGLIAAMIGGGQKQPACLSGRVTEDSFTRGRYEDLGSLDDIDQSQEDISNVTMKTSQGDIHTDGKLSQEDSDHDNDSSSSLSASGGNTDSLDCGGKRRSPPHADMTDTGDTVIFRGAAILPDGGITARPHSHESGHSELSGGERPSTDGQTPSSLNISNDCRSGAVLPHSSEEEINYQVSNDGSEVSLPQKSTVMHCRSDALSSKPQNQLSTSKKSQVLRADVVKDNHVASDPTGRTSYNSRCPPPASSNSREPLSSSMLPGQRVQNGGPHWVGQHSDPQGDSNLVAGTTRHNHIPHSSSPTLGGGATTLAELPQDVKKSRSDSSSLKRHHYNV